MSHTKIQDGYNEFTPIKQPIEIPPRITDRAWVNHIRNIWNRFNEMLDPITGNIKNRCKFRDFRSRYLTSSIYDESEDIHILYR